MAGGYFLEGGQIQGPFFNLAQAADYCGYKSPKYFRSLLKGYQIPLCGPRRNKFSRADLDRFMTDPQAFKELPARRRRKPINLVVPGERPI